MTWLPTTRCSLLLRLSKDDMASWEDFIEIYEHAIYRMALCRGLQPVDAEDVTQQVLSAVVEKVKTWNPDRGQGSFRAWLATVARNIALQVCQQNYKRESLAVDLKEGLFNDLAPRDAADLSVFDYEYRKSVFHFAARQVSKQVEAKTWQAFWLTAVEQLDVHTAAAQLEMSIASVYTARCRTLDRLRKEVVRIESDLPPVISNDKVKHDATG